MKTTSKYLSVLLVFFILISSMPISAFAVEEEQSIEINISDYTNNELDLSQYTLDDIINMTPQEYGVLVREFERVYDPYNSYVENEPLPNEGGYAPLWTSGDIDNGDYTEEGSHEVITAAACTILMNDRGFFGTSPTANIIIALLISVASLLPDKDERGIILFSGHFYNPHTGKNYAGSSTDTARNNAINRYNTAVSHANSGNMDLAIEYLGRSLHYIQDLNVPHHAANIIITNPSHTQFENFAHDNMDSYLDSYTSISSSYYTTALNRSVSNLAHDAALAAYSRKEYVNDISDKSQWYTQARDCTRSAARYSAMVMFKFGGVSSVPFYS